MSVLSVCPPSSVTHVVAHPSLSHIPKQVVLGLNASVFSGLFVLGSLLAYIKIVQDGSDTLLENVSCENVHLTRACVTTTAIVVDDCIRERRHFTPPPSRRWGLC